MKTTSPSLSSLIWSSSCLDAEFGAQCHLCYGEVALRLPTGDGIEWNARFSCCGYGVNVCTSNVALRREGQFIQEFVLGRFVRPEDISRILVRSTLARDVGLNRHLYRRWNLRRAVLGQSETTVRSLPLTRKSSSLVHMFECPRCAVINDTKHLRSDRNDGRILDVGCAAAEWIGLECGWHGQMQAIGHHI